MTNDQGNKIRNLPSFSLYDFFLPENKEISMKKNVLTVVGTFLSGLLLIILTNIVISLFLLEHSDESPFQMIFIGDSKTQYQISPYLAKKYFSLDIKNSGNNGHFYPFWGGMVAREPKTKLIVFSIPVSDFYEKFKSDNVDYFSELIDLKFIFGFVSYYYFFHYLYYALQHNPLVLLKHHKDDYQNSIYKKPICSMSGETNDEYIYHCDHNNDFLLSARFPTKRNVNVVLNDQDINKNIIAYFLHIKKFAKIHNKASVAIILLPTYGIHYQFNQNLLRQKLSIPIYDLSNYLVDQPRYWEGSGSHLNKQGRLRYTKKVLSELKNQI